MALISAARLLNVNYLLCPGWVRDTAPLSAQYLDENHVLSVSSLPAVGSWIMNESQRERESRPHSSLSESRQFHSRPAWSAELNWTEKGTNQSMKWSRSLHSLKRSVRSNDTFATDTTLTNTYIHMYYRLHRCSAAGAPLHHVKSQNESDWMLKC